MIIYPKNILRYPVCQQISYDILAYLLPFPVQIQSYARGLLVRAVDPFTRGALRVRMGRMGPCVHLRSFLEPKTPRGHTIKGSGLVAMRPHRKNATCIPLCFALARACSTHMQGLGVQGSDYNYGPVRQLDTTAIVSINGRRYKPTNSYNILGFITSEL
jgi:hypothetical protein